MSVADLVPWGNLVAIVIAAVALWNRGQNATALLSMRLEELSKRIGRVEDTLIGRTLR